MNRLKDTIDRWGIAILLCLGIGIFVAQAATTAGVFYFNSAGSCSGVVCAASVPIDSSGNPLTSAAGAAPAGASVPTQGIPLTTYFLQPTASDNHTNIKSTPGEVYWVLVENNSATVNYLRLYNVGSGFNGCNSATGLVTQIQIPASTTVGGVNLPLHYPIPFSTGISICVTAGYSTTDTTNATATAISLTLGYN